MIVLFKFVLKPFNLKVATTPYADNNCRECFHALYERNDDEDPTQI